MSNNLCTTDATGATRLATADEILDAARAILAHRVRRGAAISNPRHTRDYLRLHLASHEHEIFAILFLDNRHRVIEFVPLFRGTVDAALVKSLHGGEFIAQAQNVVFIGGTGTGTTHLATALGVQTVIHHHLRVRFYSTIEHVNLL